MIEYYSARANPYYLIYVSKLNWLYQKYFVNAAGKTKESGNVLSESVKSDKHIEILKNFDFDEGVNISKSATLHPIPKSVKNFSH